MRENDIAALKAELAELRRSVNRKLDVLEAKLEERGSSFETKKPIEKSVHQPKTSAQSLGVSKSYELEVTSINANKISDRQTSTTNFALQASDTAVPHSPEAKNIESEPSWFKTLFIQFALYFAGWLEPILTMYRSYKKRGMGHVFLLTIGGIGLTLIGIGYLMQLMIEQLDAGPKTLLFSGVSAAVIYGGFQMHKRTVFKEYAVAIVALGILIGYTTIYFSGNIYYLIGSVSTLAAYCSIAIFSHLIAKRLDVKIIYALGITGVALLPMLSAQTGHDPLWYLISVCLVGCSSLWFAYKQNLQWLVGLTLAGAFLASEWVGLSDVYSLFTMNAFFLLLLFQFAKFSQTSELKKLAPMLAGYTGGWATLLYQSTMPEMNMFLALSAFSQALLSGYTAYRFAGKNRLCQTTFTLLSTLWLCITAVYVLGQAHWGLAWLAEGAVLLYLASRLDMRPAFLSAQILVAIAILYNFIALSPYLPLPALHRFDGWILALSILFGVSYWVRLLPSQLENVTKTKTLRSALHLLEAAWLGFLILATSEYWLESWLTPLVFALQIGLLFWSVYLKEKVIELLAICLSLIPMAYTVEAFAVANSFYIGDISWPGRVALVTLFLQMWLWAEFHRRFQPEGRFAESSEVVRLGFYLLLPISWIGSAYRLLDEVVMVILWLSPLFALLLATKVKHRVLIWETKVLTLLTGFALLFSVVFVDPIYVLLGSLGYCGLLLVVYHCKYKLQAKIQAPQLLSTIIILTGLIAPTLAGISSETLAVALSVAAIYWLSIYINFRHTSTLRLLHTKALMLNRLIIITGLVVTAHNASLVFIPIVYLLLAVFMQQSKLIYSEMIGFHKNIQMHMIIVFTYGCLLVGLDTPQAMLWLGPLLAIHGVIVVLQDRSHPSVTKLGFALLALGIAKIAILDIDTTALWQKVLMFIGIGCFLLIASFWYQKMMLRYDKSV